jgi:hypothetical protein
MDKGLKTILKRRLELAYKAAHLAKTVEEFKFLVDCIKQLTLKLEEV